MCRRRIETIRRYYATLDTRERGLFEADYDQSGLHGNRYAGRSILFTMASMIHVVNSVVGGAAVALTCVLAGHLTTYLGVAIGIATGLGQLAAGLRYVHTRLVPLILDPSDG